MGVKIIPSERNSRKPRVAAYVRVSTKQEEQEGSFENQTEYYENFIKGNPAWDFAGVFGEKLSGTHIEKRGGFKQMVADALDRKIDLIYCKSVSRWARNTVEALETINLLTGNHVNVIFEQEHIDTRNSGALFSLSLAASVAQSESENISENLKWVYRNRAEQGVFIPKRGFYFGYNTDDGKFKPDGNAGIVRLMFEMFAEGSKAGEIADEVNGHGAVTTKGNPFTAHSVKKILKNEVYVGDVHIGKWPSRDVITRELDEIQCDRYVENHHEGIVSRETWEKVQRRFADGSRDREVAEHRRTRVLNLLRANPRMGRGDIAKKIGVTSEDVKILMGVLSRRGWIRKEMGKWVVDEEKVRTSQSD